MYFYLKRNNFEGLLRTGLGTDEILIIIGEFIMIKANKHPNILKFFEAVFPIQSLYLKNKKILLFKAY